MRKLTMSGFLSGYVKSLSENRTLNIHKLTGEVYNGNHRLREPLFLYCYYSGKSDILLKYLNDDDTSEYNYVSRLLKKNQISSLPSDFEKVINSYSRRVGMPENDNHIKSLMLDKIIKLQKEKHVTNYRIYKDLQINPGNFNSFIKNRNLNKLSLNKSREVYNYLQNL
ncbi:MAG: transcriptional regulator [Oscillospiraceae bacterium]|nr:transcriptional regulator [Oscillospiraceae bacterium]